MILKSDPPFWEAAIRRAVSGLTLATRVARYRQMLERLLQCPHLPLQKLRLWLGRCLVTVLLGRFRELNSE